MGPVWSLFGKFPTRSLEPATWFTWRGGKSASWAIGVGSTQWHQDLKCALYNIIQHYTSHFSIFSKRVWGWLTFCVSTFSTWYIFVCPGVSWVFMTFCPHFCCWIIFISRTFKQQCQFWCLLSKVSTDFIPVIMLWLEWVNGLVCGRRTVSNLRTMVFRGYIIYRTCCMGLQTNW